jgi:adenylate cyclase
MEPMADSKPRRRLAAIVAADVVGYSRLMEADETGTLDAVRALWAETFNPTVAAHHGRIVKMMGDGALVEFASAVDAVESAIALQRTMATYNTERPDHPPIEFRIGVNLGDIVIEGDDIFGEGVNIAARLEGKAPHNGVLISDAVYAQIKGKIDEKFTNAGELALKNIAKRVRAWSWGGDGVSFAKADSPNPEPGDTPSIAVLPFANMSGDPEQEFFADGLVEDIITTLSKLARLRVIARNSSFVYKDQTVDVREVARQLGVQFVLEGSVRKAGNRVRITAQLIDAKDGSHVWAERYDRSMDDIFAIQDEITLVLATEMQVKLTEGEQARLQYTTTDNVEAWTHWARGMSHYRQAVTKETMGPARFHWEKALALDPDSAALNAMLGFMHGVDARFGWWDDRETALQKARAYADRALEIEPTNGNAHSMSSVIMLFEERFDDAVRGARKAIELAPGSADVAEFASFVLTPCGFPEEAVIQSEKAIALSPNHPPVYLGAMGNAYHLAGRIDEAIEAFKTYNEKSPGFGLLDLVIIYQQNDRPEEARQTAEQFLAARPGFTITAWRDTQIRRDQGRLEADITALTEAGLPLG